MVDAAKKVLKDRNPTGPREKATLMYVTWIPESEQMIVRFLTRITDGDYKYGGGINIELNPLPIPPGPPQGGPAIRPRLENGLRFGTQLGIEFGQQFEVSKNGKVDKVRTLEIQSFVKELPAPPAFNQPKTFPLPVVPLKLPQTR